ncbi:MAG: WG repeat-containing protein [Bryobacteraceae bacterium]
MYEQKLQDSGTDDVEVTHAGTMWANQPVILAAGGLLIAVLLVFLVTRFLEPEHLFPAPVNSRFGYIDKSGKMVIAPQF